MPPRSTRPTRLKRGQLLLLPSLKGLLTIDTPPAQAHQSLLLGCRRLGCGPDLILTWSLLRKQRCMLDPLLPY
eukprot:327290-Amphidinium_carterae.1